MDSVKRSPAKDYPDRAACVDVGSDKLDGISYSKREYSAKKGRDMKEISKKEAQFVGPNHL